MSEVKISVFISRCLTYGIKLYPFQQETILRASEKYKVPDKVLELFDRKKLESYIEALDWSSREDNRDWSKGHEMLKEIGFIQSEREEGHRKFVSLSYPSELIQKHTQ